MIIFLILFGFGLLALIMIILAIPAAIYNSKKEKEERDLRLKKIKLENQILEENLKNSRNE